MLISKYLCIAWKPDDLNGIRKNERVCAGPTTATLGMSLQVPIAVALDIVLQKVHYAKWGAVVLMVLGGWFVLAGFVGITIPPRQASSQTRTQSPEPLEQY